MNLKNFIKIISGSLFTMNQFENEKIEQMTKEDQTFSTDVYYYLNVTSDQTENVITQLMVCMETQKPWLNPDLRLIDLSRMICYPTSILSFIFSTHLKMRYNDYVNQYRIKNFIELVEKEKCKNYTIVALANESGFSSKATFFRTFKKMMGMTPKQYMKINRLK